MVIKKIYHRIKRVFTIKYFVFGDSHVEVFQYIERKKIKPFHQFDVTLVGGATAQGMRNPNSKTNALQIFTEKIEKLLVTDRLIFQLGEVDTGFVMWYRAIKYNESIEKQLAETIKIYFAFIDKLLIKGFKKITLISAPLPTIEDNQEWGEVANARKEVKASKKERTDLTLKYNNILKENCNKRGIKFIDCSDELIDKTTGYINLKFKNKDPLNHHLDLYEYSKIILKKL